MDIIEQLYEAEKNRKENNKQNKSTQITEIQITEIQITEKINIKQYCALSKEQKWLDWLQQIAPDQYEKLIEHNKNNTGCRENRQIMSKIHQELINMGKYDELYKFIEKEYPILINKSNWDKI